MTDKSKPEALTDAELDDVQGGIYSTSAAGTDLYSMDAGMTELKPRKAPRKGDGWIAFGAETTT